tara:strand:- start:1237 stop:2088 length:852 start_codon:yes stop_codon:yes gene_type:complete
MENYFSIVDINLGTNFEERVSIGLLLLDAEKAIFRFSNEKLVAVRSLLTNQKATHAKKYLKSIETELPDAINEPSRYLEGENNWISFQYLNYLSRYSNNLIRFSAPQVINLEVSESNFTRLFNQFIYDSTKVKILQKDKPDLISYIKKNLYTKIESKVNLNKKLTSNDFKELIKPQVVDFIGVNGRIVAGQAIDFTKKTFYLEHDIMNFIAFSKAVDVSRSDYGKYFVLGKEPVKKEDGANHNLWQQIYNSSMVEFIDSNETDKVEDYIQKKGVQPLFNHKED